MGHTVTDTTTPQRVETEATAAPPLAAVVAENLRAHIARKRLTGRQFAALTGWSTSTTGRRLAGEQPLSLNDLEQAARVLGVSVRDLIAA